MPVTPNPTSTRFTGLSTPAALATAVVAAVAGSTVLNTVIAAIAHAAGASHSFRPLQIGTYTALTVVGVLIGALAWNGVRTRSARPATILRRLVPTVLALSFIPDIVVGVSKSQPHTTWGAVAALMCMHLVVGAVSIAVFTTLLPVRLGESAGAPQAARSDAVS